MTKYETTITIEKNVLNDTPKHLGRVFETYTDDLLGALGIESKTAVMVETATLNKDHDAIEFIVGLEVK